MGPARLSTVPPLDRTESLFAFLASSPSPYHAVANAAARLDRAGFRRLHEADAWDDDIGAGYLVRGGALVAWRRPVAAPPSTPFRVIGAHTDSPNLRLKPRPDAGSAGWRQLAVEVYGGALANSWLDRDLGLSGRLVRADGRVELVLIDRPLARVPQLAIHLDRDVNERGLLLDRQAHLTPIWGLGAAHDGALLSFVAGEVGVDPADIVAFDLMFHDLTPPARLGRDGELIAAGRLDNLFSCWAAIEAIVENAPRDDIVALVCLFDHEEVGSGSTSGAAGPLLATVIDRLVAGRSACVEDRHRALAASVCVSADMAHAVHPNYVERHEPGHRPLPNAGPVLKVNANQRYATDATTHAVFVAACRHAGVPWQVFVSRNNMPCGSTIGPLTATRLGIATVDVGCAQLSMHSARELAGADDGAYLVAALGAFLGPS
jgi:aspartyl aminopeptidase